MYCFLSLCFVRPQYYSLECADRGNIILNDDGNNNIVHKLGASNIKTKATRDYIL